MASDNFTRRLKTTAQRATPPATAPEPRRPMNYRPGTRRAGNRLAVGRDRQQGGGAQDFRPQSSS
jgi:hypothetical protein